MLLPIPPALAVLAFTFCQPLVLTRIIAFLGNNEDVNIGYGLIGAYALIYVGIAVRQHECKFYARVCTNVACRCLEDSTDIIYLALLLTFAAL